MCTHGFILQSDWYHQSKVPEVMNSSRGCYQALSYPHFGVSCALLPPVFKE